MLEYKCKNLNKKISPHVDSLVGHISKWIKIDPSINELEHTMESPNPNLKQLDILLHVKIMCQDKILLSMIRNGYGKRVMPYL